MHKLLHKPNMKNVEKAKLSNPPFSWDMSHTNIIYLPIYLYGISFQCLLKWLRSTCLTLCSMMVLYNNNSPVLQYTIFGVPSCQQEETADTEKFTMVFGSSPFSLNVVFLTNLKAWCMPSLKLTLYPCRVLACALSPGTGIHVKVMLFSVTLHSISLTEPGKQVPVGNKNMSVTYDYHFN